MLFVCRSLPANEKKLHLRVLCVSVARLPSPQIASTKNASTRGTGGQVNILSLTALNQMRKGTKKSES
jgi:hypothetical protein